MAIDNGILPMFAGDTRTIEALIDGEDLLPLNLSGCTPLFELFRNVNYAPILTKTLGSGVTIEDVEGQMMAVVRLVKNDTLTLPKGEYEYRLKITNTIQQTSTVSKGRLGIER